MLPEVLVIIACLKTSGCTQTSNNYYALHPEIKTMLEEKENNIKNYVGPYVVGVVTPFIYLATGGTANIFINENFSLQTSQTKVLASFRKDF
jgi:hypothetical protein